MNKKHTKKVKLPSETHTLVTYDDGSPPANTDVHTCTDLDKLLSDCNEMCGKGSYAAVLGSKDGTWVIRLLTYISEDESDSIPYKAMKHKGQIPLGLKLMPIKDHIMQNWLHAKNLECSCVPTIYNTAATDDLFYTTMERLEPIDDHIGKRPFKREFTHILARLIISNGMLCQKTGLTLWDFHFGNIMVRKQQPLQSYSVAIPAIPIHMQIKIPEGMALVLVDLDSCTSMDPASRRPCTSPAWGIPDYYVTHMNAMGWTRTMLLRMLLTNAKESRIIWRSHSLLRVTLTALSAFMPELSSWINTALDQLGSNTTVAHTMALAAANAGLTLFLTREGKETQVENFTKDCRCEKHGLKNDVEFWECLILSLMGLHKAHKMSMPKPFLVMQRAAHYTERDFSQFGLAIVSLCRKLSLPCDINIPSNHSPHSWDASSTISSASSMF